ncbi:hypothetical protein ACLK1T_21835 [Escherichia coli]
MKLRDQQRLENRVIWDMDIPNGHLVMQFPAVVMQVVAVSLAGSLN